MLDRADCADFGCHNSIRLETKHFLNTLALTFISFSGRFVFAMQKHYLFFCERSLVFLFFAKHKNAYILKTVLDRADCADFGCHNSIRLETKHFLNTLALTFISFSGCFVFAMQKHYLFFLRAILWLI